jgi:hypothetical protein
MNVKLGLKLLVIGGVMGVILIALAMERYDHRSAEVPG